MEEKTSELDSELRTLMRSGLLSARNKHNDKVWAVNRPMGVVVKANYHRVMNEIG